MRNITVSVSDQTYRNARIWAAENNTSISAAVEYLLQNLRSILSVHKPPREARRNNRYEVPLPSPAESGRGELMSLVNLLMPSTSDRPSRRRTEFRPR